MIEWSLLLLVLLAGAGILLAATPNTQAAVTTGPPGATCGHEEECAWFYLVYPVDHDVAFDPAFFSPGVTSGGNTYYTANLPNTVAVTDPSGNTEDIAMDYGDVIYDFTDVEEPDPNAHSWVIAVCR